MATHNDFGKQAEEAATAYLQQKGYQILERNFFYQHAEIDIIAQYQNFLVIVEVKARASNQFGEPYSFVNQRKIELLAKAADHFAQSQETDCELRFDIISVLKTPQGFDFEHIENAFFPF